ncbi:MAG: hypothetical protein REJ23_15350 [Brevundimonas sp.]|nr:hypothetical protein [Brevundimonas sp.]
MMSASLAAVLLTAFAPSADTPVIFPADFHGRWDLSAEHCRRDESGSALTISERQIVGYEDTSTLKSARVLDGGSLHVVLDNESAEGDREIQMVIWRSSDGGEWLNIEGDARPQAVRYARCGA